MIRRAFLAAMLLSGLGAVAWAGDAPGTAQVTIDNFSFSPQLLTIAPGTKVTWTNRDDIPHTVTSSEDPAHVRSGPLDTDESYSMTFDKPGTYGFFCSLHPHMTSKVVVQ